MSVSFLKDEIQFYTRSILDSEGLHDWKTRFMKGDEAFCETESKTIVIGENNTDYKQLVLHEVTHALLPPRDYLYNHYGKIFNDLYRKLCVKYRVNGESWYEDDEGIKHETIFWRMNR